MHYPFCPIFPSVGDLQSSDLREVYDKLLLLNLIQCALLSDWKICRQVKSIHHQKVDGLASEILRSPPDQEKY